MNQVYLTGRLGKDPELRYTQGGTAVVKFSMATKETYKGETKTMWNNIVAWGKLAEICTKYLEKGSQVLVRGRISHSNWEKDGVKRTSMEVVAEEVEFLGSKGRQEQEQEEDIPF